MEIINTTFLLFILIFIVVLFRKFLKKKSLNSIENDLIIWQKEQFAFYFGRISYALILAEFDYNSDSNVVTKEEHLFLREQAIKLLKLFLDDNFDEKLFNYSNFEIVELGYNTLRSKFRGRVENAFIIGTVLEMARAIKQDTINDEKSISHISNIIKESKKRIWTKFGIILPDNKPFRDAVKELFYYLENFKVIDKEIYKKLETTISNFYNNLS